MIGGYQILDLRGIDLTKGSVASNITNAYVLKQLLQLRDHIDKAYDFSKPLTNQLKPVLIRFRDKKNGEKTEGATFGELSVNGNYYTFKITARISGALVLTINVAFEEITNDYGNKEWVIDTATILLKDESKTITGDLELSGDLSVGDDAEITGDASVGGALSVTGNVSGAKFIGDVALESIKDADGHARFIEGNLQVVEITGLTSVYAKWSLSGSHLMIVLAGTFDAETVITDNIVIASVNLPSWIMDKIYPVEGTLIETKGVNCYASGMAYNYQTINLSLAKGTASSIDIRNIVGAQTVTNNSSFRAEFDLLIDNE